MLHYPTLQTTFNTHHREGKLRIRHLVVSARSSDVHIKRLRWIAPVEYIGCVVVSACGGEDGCLRFLLQVAVDLEAVVPRVRHCHVTIRCEGQTLRAVKGVRCCVDVGQEGP